MLILLGCFSPTLSYAQGAGATPKIAEQPCDANYWRQMTFRAWQEAEREIMQNQNLIFKPDSVLQYTCFDQFNQIAAAQGGEIFVHTTYFGEQIIKRSQKEGMTQALAAVVYNPLKSYVASNGYAGDMLGGRASRMSIPSSKSQFSGPGGTSASYSCKQMSDIWQTAKCANFIDNSNFSGDSVGDGADGFYPFGTIKGLDGAQDVKGYDTLKDVRIYPTACNNFTAWPQLEQLAENQFETFYKFQTPLGEIYKEVNDKILPVKNGASGGEPYAESCGTAIKTGVKVITKDGEKGDDGVCTNPGCTYSNGSCS